MYNGLLLSQKRKKKKNEIIPFAATWMELEIIILSEVSKRECRDVDGLESVIQSEVSQKEKNKYHILMHVCGI